MRASLLAIVLLLVGCAGMSESQCRNTNWAELGERDGLFGGPPRIEVYAYQCGRHNVAAAEQAYLDGWFIGNREYDVRAGSHDGGQ